MFVDHFCLTLKCGLTERHATTACTEGPAKSRFAPYKIAARPPEFDKSVAFLMFA
jgi:hypothetical protein